MQTRIHNFRAELYCNPIRKNNLQALLTGTLAAAVNVGPLKLCEVFLGPNANPAGASLYPVDKQEYLRESLAECFLLAKVGVQLNAGIIGPEQLQLQDMLENKMQSIMTEFTDKYGSNIKWNKLQDRIQESERKAVQQAADLAQKLNKSETKKVLITE